MPFVLRGISSRAEGPGGGRWNDGVLEKSSWPDITFIERMELGGSALEDVSLVGEIDLARSVQLH